MFNLSHLQLGDVLHAQGMDSAEPVHFMPNLQRTAPFRLARESLGNAGLIYVGPAKPN